MHARPHRRARDLPAANSRAAHYAILLIGGHCRRCGCAAEAACFWLPPGHEQRLEDDDDAPWAAVQTAVVLHAVSWIDPVTRARLAAGLPTFRPATRAGAGRRPVWLNHCEHCAAPVPGLDDEDTRATVGIALTGALAAPVVLVTSGLPVSLRADGWTYGDLADAALASLESAALPTGAEGLLP